MNLMHLKYAVEVAATHSISKAAENLYMNQPNLSRAIKELEESLGVQLFNRTSKGIKLTRQGEDFIVYAQRILYQMDPFIEEASINLGVSPMKTFFTVTARMMLPGIMSGAVLSWITCINELSSSIMLYSGKTSTIAVAIYQEVVRMSDGTAAALATILTLTTIISLVIVFRATKGKVKIV